MKSLLVSIRLLVSVAAVVVVAAGVGMAAEKPPAGEPLIQKYTTPYLIRFEGVIDPIRQFYLERKLQVAEKAGADLLVIEINSPGGLVRESFAIADRLADIDWAHTVAFVPNEAISGGAFIAYGCDEIIMAPEATLGDAGPIFLDENNMFRHVPEKERSVLATQIRTLAERKGRSTALAEAMVDMDLVVYKVRNRKSGEETLMTRKEIESSPNPEHWEELQPIHETKEGQFFTVNGKRALELAVATANVANRTALQEHFGLENDFVVLEATWVDTTVMILNLPLVTVVLFIIGLVALYVEFSAPGIGIGGSIAALCFAIFFWSRFLGGTAGWLEVILFVAGISFLIVELFVLPGFGVSGLTGILLIVASLVLASQTYVFPQTSFEWVQTAVSLVSLTGAGVVVVIAAFFISKHFGMLPVVGKMALQPPEPDEVVSSDGATASASEHLGVQLGDVGVAGSLLRPAGIVRFGNKRVDVVTNGEFVEPGGEVEVIEISGNRIVVKPV